MIDKTSQLPKRYEFTITEKKWQDFWQKKNIYKWHEGSSDANNYVIDTPPPTVSGQLHMGHMYSYTQTDFIARYKRMQGFNVFYPMGFDDNGLPTERLVEKAKKVKAISMARNEFTRICTEVIVDEELKFQKLFNNIALSVDWSQQYQSISPKSCTISQMSFLDLVNKGEVYRSSEPILWDVIDQTALSQADIEDKERTSIMYDIIFTTISGDDIKISTTRPELLPACVAVFVHPSDPRYKDLEGSEIISPIFGVKVPLLQDELVNPEKGTGAVMCCTFGDQTDVIWRRKYQLKDKLIIEKNGLIKENIEFDENCIDVAKARSFANMISNLKVVDARSKIVEILKEQKLILKETEVIQAVKCAERSGAPIEIIVASQWFVNTIKHKNAMLERSNHLEWRPKTMKIKLDNWINAISLDWCISRQRYFGVPFPVWYSKRVGEEGKPIFAEIDQLPIDPSIDLPRGYSREEIEPDYDVMDTWATSSVSPQLNSLGINDEFAIDSKRHEILFPADLRPQAHEILRTWGFYTILKSHLHNNLLPWKTIMISGWCLAEDKTKMSKSKGNIISPEKLLETFGADVMRYWSGNSKLGADTAYSEDVMHNGKRLVNKLWNAAKFIYTHFEKTKITSASGQDLEQKLMSMISSDFDYYAIDKIHNLVNTATKSFEDYEYSVALNKTEEFFWSFFCDNYLEISKTRVYNENNQDHAGSISAAATMCYSFSIILKLFAPFLPHITEELYQYLYLDNSASSSIHDKFSWPNPSELNIAINKLEDISKSSEVLISILDLVRKAKAAANLSIKAPISLIEVKGVSMLSKDLLVDLKNVTSANDIKFVEYISEPILILRDVDIEINIIYST